MSGRASSSAWWQGSLLLRLLATDADGRPALRESRSGRLLEALGHGLGRRLGGPLAALDRAVEESRIGGGLLALLARAGGNAPAGLLAVTVALLPWAPQFLDAGLLLLDLLLLAMEAARGRLRLRSTPLDTVVLLFAWVAAVGALTSVDRSGSLYTLGQYAVYFAAYLLASRLLGEERAVRAFWLAAIASGALAGLDGIYQYFTLHGTPKAWIDVETSPGIRARVYGALENPNVYAQYLVLLLLPALALLIWRPLGAVWRGAPRWRLAGATLLMLAGLVLSFSRGGWLSFAAAAGALLLLLEPRWLLYGLAAGVLALLAVTPLRDRFFSAFTLADTSNSFRLYIWTGVLAMIRAYWLFGAGLGLRTFQYVYPHWMITGVVALSSHNQYLEMLAELGVVGLAAYLALGLRTLQVAWNAFRAWSGRDAWRAGAAAGVLGAVLGNMVHGFVDTSWYSPRVVMLFWLVAGAAGALRAAAGEGAAEAAEGAGGEPAPGARPGRPVAPPVARAAAPGRGGS
ncbi:MAG: O-antigen ligase family protein [Firmicutes bacterium]|nr:O-antigen ligase family protein [Bacillota bacterium]